MFKTVITKSGLSSFIDNLVFELKYLDPRVFVEYWSHLTREQMLTNLEEKIKSNLSCISSGSTLDNSVQLVMDRLEEEDSIQKLIDRRVEKTSVVHLHWMTEDKFKEVFKLTKQNILETTGQDVSYLTILNGSKEDDLSYLNIERLAIGMSALNVEDVDYKSLEEFC